MQTIDTLENENKLLRESLYILQELAQEDQDTIKTLQEELEAAKRKYKFIWDKTVKDFAQNEKKVSE